MATFEITEGRPGQGKSLYTSRIAKRLILRNKRWYAKLMRKWENDLLVAIGNGRWSEVEEIYYREPMRRIVASNMRFSEAFEKEHEGWLMYWTDTYEVVNLRDVDLIWDEIATELDSRNFANLSTELKRFLSQYRKRGVDIYANTQDFSMIDMRARLMVTSTQTLTKIIGSRDISTTKPNPRWIWGLIIIRSVENFTETDPEKKKYGMIPGFFFITKEDIAIYDTRQDIPQGKPAPLRHIELVCQHHDEPGHVCNFKKVVHQ